MRTALALLLLVAGCGTKEVRLAGTANRPIEQLAVLHLRQHDGLTAWHGQPIHIKSFYLDQAEYGILKDTKFVLVPGEQILGIDYGPCVHGFGAVVAPLNVDNELYGGPFGRFTAELEPGGHYELVARETLTGQNAVQTEHELQRFDPATRPAR